ncbi:MAG: hypothetical protein EAX81_07265 [Candidatus Thorarchaeota archaeon]|nr:hypothetical protein [Candidatus Thorarchaeota archaeon]
MKNYLAVLLQVVGFVTFILASSFGYTLGNITWFRESSFVFSTYLQYDSMMMNTFLVMIGSLFLSVSLLLQCNGLMEWGVFGGVVFFASFLVGVSRIALFPPNWGVPGSGFLLEMLIPFEALFLTATGLTLFGLLCFGFHHRTVSRISLSRSLTLFLMISVLFVVLMAIRGAILISGAHGAIPYPVLSECSILLFLPYSIGLIMASLGLYEAK